MGKLEKGIEPDLLQDLVAVGDNSSTSVRQRTKCLSDEDRQDDQPEK